MFASLVIRDARVFTADEQQPTAEAVAVRENQIVYVGNEQGVSAFIGPQTRVIDGRGRSLLPGFIDSHFHLEWGGQNACSRAALRRAFIGSARRGAPQWRAENPDQPWVLGQGLSYALPTVSEPLTRHYLDKIESEKPLVLTAFDVHSMFVNTVALEIMGLRRGPAEPLTVGEIVVDENGWATGELYEMAAMDMVYQAMPQPTTDQRIKTIKRGLALAAAHGITSMHNMDGDLAQGELYAAMNDMGLMTARVMIPYWVKPGTTIAEMTQAATEMRDRFQGEKVRSNCVKFFMDGVYESYTAVTLDGYPDQPQNHGEPIWPANKFAEMVTTADGLGLQIFVHACGDGAVRRVLDGYEAAQQTNGRRDSRHRVEHIEMIDPADIGRFRELGVVASMQPLHAPLETGDSDVWVTRIHAQRSDDAFAWRAMREAEIPIAFGSDWPVVPLNVLLGIYGAVNRQPLVDGGKAHHQTLVEAICAYTRDAAYAEHQETRKGQLKAGMWADMVLTSADLFAIPPESIKDVVVDLTICDGQIVFDRDLGVPS